MHYEPATLEIASLKLIGKGYALQRIFIADIW